MAQLISLLRTCFPRNITKTKAAYSDVRYLNHPIYHKTTYTYTALHNNTQLLHPLHFFFCSIIKQHLLSIFDKLTQ